ncbi:MAG: CDP-alcohol phosphatidyltransferase family protein [Longimicrobiales bacterium]
MQHSERVRAALTAKMEKRLLVSLARRLPGWVHSDHLTILGVIAAIGIGAGYALSILSPHWLWLASAMLALNWFGDSLDGTVARVRRAERPRYGYYLDHAVDAFTTVLIGLGIGLSPFVSLFVGLGIVIIYLLMSINVYLESTVFGEFKMDYGVLGPTEVRILLIALNTVAIWVTTTGRTTPGEIAPGANLAFSAVLGVMALLLLWRFGGNLRRLAREDPLPHP